MKNFVKYLTIFFVCAFTVFSLVACVYEDEPNPGEVTHDNNGNTEPETYTVRGLQKFSISNTADVPFVLESIYCLGGEINGNERLGAYSGPMTIGVNETKEIEIEVSYTSNSSYGYVNYYMIDGYYQSGEERVYPKKGWFENGKVTGEFNQAINDNAYTERGWNFLGSGLMMLSSEPCPTDTDELLFCKDETKINSSTIIRYYLCSVY